ncbi:MAG: valine--tRNA ligase [candidate division WOR-3 bacterium]|nr:valine--tRNA ligase [candidate division WOR-3 bacterium]
MELPKRYDPKPVEEKWYKFWESNGYFRANAKSPKPSFCIVIPPPNITGSLHTGHALNNTLQDILIRWKKLHGYEVLWLPGTDHASIGTHVQIEKALAKEGKTRFDLGREAFLKYAWEWKNKYGNRIIEQLKRMGCACDWSRLRFTMDDMLSRAVREAFVRYYEKGLIYRGAYIVNWCPSCKTAISDLEVKHKESEGNLWYIKYPLQDPCANLKRIVVATTRPETMLGDTAVAVHPDDERYKSCIGKTVCLPLVNRMIPIVAIDLVDQDFGTGAVKVTPAHDPVDFEIANRTNLEFVKVIDENGCMTDKVPKQYQGLTREECRKAVVHDLAAQGLLEKIEPYRLRITRCERCETIVEPLVSLQWFLKMKDLAMPAIKVVEQGKVQFVPERWTKVYLDWMNNIKDWCISRQLWWGHRIPVFYCADCDEIMVAREDPKSCPKCKSKDIRQDEDILDTWFSSALWPFSTMGWPNPTEDLKKFYPTDFLSTAPEIIFLWVARMIFSGLEFVGAIPFRKVYIHSIILNEQGERMSRSKGIGVDPLEIIDKYSADALRFTLAYLESQSQSYRLREQKFEMGRNFTNKIWNAARLVQPYLTEMPEDQSQSQKDLEPIDRWILAKYNRIVNSVEDGLEKFNFSYVSAELYNFFWHDLCDWYLEFVKPRLKAKDSKATYTLKEIFSGILRLLHPFTPFITEELWQKFQFSSRSIMLEPAPNEIKIDESDLEKVEILKDLIVSVRNIRTEMNVEAAKKVSVLINSENKKIGDFLIRNEGIISDLAKVATISYANKRPHHSSIAVLPGLEIYVPLEGIIDLEKERKRIAKEIENQTKELTRTRKRLVDERFLKNAKPEVIEREKERKNKFTDRIEKLKKLYKEI